MKYKLYPEYKDSGVEWLGDVPEEWTIKRLKTVLSRNDGGVWGEDFDDNGIIVLRSTEQTVNGEWCIEEPARRLLSHSEYAASRLSCGDLVVTKSSGSALHIGKTTIVTQEIEELNCCYSNFMQRLRVKSQNRPRFLYYIINGPIGRAQFVYGSNTTTGLANLNSEVIGNVILALPSVSEQRTIADFLDRRTGQIDELIAKKERVIELLREKRTALISHAVTKGLNPDAKMKDSGVEWLGKMPEHWEVKRLKHLLSKIRSGKTPRGGAEVYISSGVMLLRSQNVHYDGLRLDDVVFIDVKTDTDMAGTRVNPNDVLLNITGASIGRCSLVPPDFGKANVNQHVCIIRPLSNDVLSPYLHAIMSSQGLLSQIFASENGTSREGLNFQQVGRLIVALPTELSEQQTIVDFLNRETSRIDALIAKVTEAIEKLKEYRTALISAAVTGKIKVN